METIVITKEKATRVFNICNKSVFFYVRFKTEREKAFIKVSAKFGARKYEAETWADEEMIAAVKSALLGYEINIEEYLKTDHVAIDNANIEFEIFKEDIEGNTEMKFSEDFTSSKGDLYLCARAYYDKGCINYCLKRTMDVEFCLSDNGLF